MFCLPVPSVGRTKIVQETETHTTSQCPLTPLQELLHHSIAKTALPPKTPATTRWSLYSRIVDGGLTYLWFLQIQAGSCWVSVTWWICDPDRWGGWSLCKIKMYNISSVSSGGSLAPVRRSSYFAIHIWIQIKHPSHYVKVATAVCVDQTS